MALVKIEWTFPKWAEKFKAEIPVLMNIAAATIQTNRGMLFDKSGAYNGHQKWKNPLLWNGQPLAGKGVLRNSISPRNNGKVPVRGKDGVLEIVGERITIGTTLRYAKILNTGGVIVAKNAQALKIPLPEGKRASPVTKSLRKEAVGNRDTGRFIFRKKVTIPERNFTDWNSQDKKELEETLRNAVAAFLNRD